MRFLSFGLGGSLLFVVASAMAGTSGGSGGAVGVTRTDWPCAGCAVGVPDGLNQTPGAKLLVLLHGDEGTAVPIFNAFAPELRKTTDFILFAPQCPLANHCTDGAWWHTGPPTDDWINQQVAAIEAQYNIDYDHEHLGGVSGGAIYISAILAYLYPDRYGSANLISGGIPPSVSACPSCLMPFWFVEGDQDFEYTLGRTPATRDYYKACGDEINFELVPGLDHQGAANHAIAEIPSILDWFRSHPNTCPARRGVSGSSDAGPRHDQDAGDAAPQVDGGDRAPASNGNDAAPFNADTKQPGVTEAQSGCACRTSASKRGAAAAWIATAAAIVAFRGRRRRRHSAEEARQSRVEPIEAGRLNAHRLEHRVVKVAHVAVHG
jgi:predicted esterase